MSPQVETSADPVARRPRSLSIGTLVWSIMLLIALGAVALVSGGWLISLRLSAERSRAEALESERSRLEGLALTVVLWRDSAIAALGPEAGEISAEALEQTRELSVEILNQVSSLADSALYQERQPVFESIVAGAGRVAALLSSLEPGKPARIEDRRRLHARVHGQIEKLGPELEGVRRVANARALVEHAAVRRLETGIGRGLAAFSAAYVLLVLFLARRMRSRVVAPIHRLTSSARALITGESETMPSLTTAPAELRELSEAFASLVVRLSSAQHAAEAADRAKSRFLAIMSHEIRTPLTAILGCAELLRDDIELNRAPEEQRAVLRAILKSGEHLVQILNDVLDLSKIEAGMLDVERVPVSPVRLVSEVESLMQASARESGIELRLEFPTPLPASVDTDPTRLRQVLINLVGNAIKFTDAGSVRIVSRLRGRGAGAWLELAVVDSGPGMTPEETERIFEPFTQGASLAPRSQGGTGLGLSICRHLTDLLGGVIEVESQAGSGSTFRLSLPLAAADSAVLVEDPARIALPADDAPDPRHEGEQRLACSVLLVEDAPAVADLFRRSLTRAGASVELAENGAVGVERALAAASAGQPFDVILMDVQMPLLDGYGATRALRAQGYAGPIIALTANATLEERERCLQAGCDDVGSKPIDQRTLAGLIRRHLSG